MFVRIKNIKSKCGSRYAYAYLCENYWVNGKTKQRVLKYLGRVGIGKITKLDIMKLFRKHNYQCAICKSDNELGIDHIIPLTKGGTNDFYNLQILCKVCNNKKGTHIGNEVLLNDKK